MTLKLVTAPTVPVLTVAEVKTHLRIDTADHDAELQTMIDTVIAHIGGRDGWLGRPLSEQTWQYQIDCFPSFIRLPLPPLQSVTSITYIDTSGTSVVLDSSLYRVVDMGDDEAIIEPIYGGTWPTTRSVRGAVVIQFVCGYPTDGASTPTLLIPEPIKLGAKMIVGNWFENRESILIGITGAELPMGARDLLRPYRVPFFG